MRVKLILHGVLKTLCPDVLEFEVRTAAEAIKALSKQVKALAPNPRRGRFQVRVADLTVEQIFAPLEVNELHLVPDLCGGKKGGMMKIVLGALLVAAAIAMPAGTVIGSGMFEMSASTLFWSGASMILGGLMEAVSPAPKMDQGSGFSGPNDPEASKYLGAPKNTVEIGTRIPIAYGEVQLYGHYLSFDIQAQDVI